MDLEDNTTSNTTTESGASEQQFRKKYFSEIMELSPEDIYRYTIDAGLTEGELGCRSRTVFCNALSGADSDRRYLYLNSYCNDQAKLLGLLCHSIRECLSEKECDVVVCNVDKWVQGAVSGDKLVIISSEDFNFNTVYSVIFMKETYYNIFNDAYTNGSPTGVGAWCYSSVKHLPVAKYNILDPLEFRDFYKKENVSRFSGAKWFSNIQEKTALIAGIGGIGSWTTMMLSRMQLKNIILYDPDVVEASNMSGQMYSKLNIGQPKVTALSDTIYNYSDYTAVVEHQECFSAATSPCDIMISGFDNMQARKDFFKCWKTHVLSLPEDKRQNCLYIDGRLSAETLQVYCITGDDEIAIDEYQTNALFSSEEAEATVCSYKQTTYMANMIGSVITNLFTNFTANLATGAPIRTLPYFTEYEGALMKFNTVML